MSDSTPFDPSTITWETPPTSTPRTSRYAPFYEALKAKPGAWAKWPGEGKSPSIPTARSAEGFKTSYRSVGGTTTMYVVFEPKGKKEAK